MTTVRDHYLPDLRAHYAKGGTAVAFASKHRLNPSLVWQWAVADGLQKAKPRGGRPEVSEKTLRLLDEHLRAGGEIVTFAHQLSVDKGTVSRWAMLIGWKHSYRWINAKAKQRKLMPLLAKELEKGGSATEFAKKHDIPTKVVFTWARSLGWVAVRVWEKEKL